MFKKNMEDEVVTSQRIGETAEDSCTKLWQGINLVMMIFFLLSTYVQLNDPDPYIWVPIYIIPSFLCLSVVLKADSADNTLWHIVSTTHLVCCVLGMLYHLALVIEIMAGRLYNPLVHEEGRELAGLVIIIIWLMVCRFTSFGRKNRVTSTSSLVVLLVVSVLLSIIPLFVWSLCFISGFDTQLSHCNGMFPGMLGAATTR
ncbi:hypothetical protein LSH36_46g00038 [Paralvinella palmiformis]|uniref:Transmembrane protein 220 n=1 Tax=Paralvinella palmiformis TaxID=53620 RepID=A0AAD9NFW4_9ANNE|nr:hypothetical protein LSH36_46g00038 [Paralvinella palmiformis]